MDVSGSIPGEGMVMMSSRPLRTPAQRLHRGLGGIKVPHHQPGRPDKLFAGFTEDRPAADPVEERHAQLLLQGGDGLGKGRLGDEQMLRGPVEPVVVNNGQEILQLSGVHASSLTSPVSWASGAAKVGPPGGKVRDAEA